MNEQEKIKIPFEIDLVDGVIQNIKHPNTFHIPSNEVKSYIGIGNRVKVIDKKYRERFWVEIEDFIDDYLMIGIIRNDLVSNQPYTFNDKIFLKMDNIISVEVNRNLSKRDRGIFMERRTETLSRIKR
jgi:hypothetical protein